MIDFVTAYLHDEKCGGHQFQEDHIRKPAIGEIYKVIYFCDPFDEDNYFVTVTTENIDFITHAMTDPNNDITEYKKIRRYERRNRHV